MAGLTPLHLRTSRLVVSGAETTDASGLAAYHTKNQHHLRPWEPPRRGDEWKSPAYWSERLEEHEVERDRGLAFRFVLRSMDAAKSPILGTANLTQIVRGAFQACYLGFSLDEDSVGQGLMFEALSAVLKFAFETLELHRVMANHLPENLRSARLLRRLGFVVEGYARDYLFIKDAWRDHVLTALTNSTPRISE